MNMRVVSAVLLMMFVLPFLLVAGDRETSIAPSSSVSNRDGISFKDSIDLLNKLFEASKRKDYTLKQQHEGERHESRVEKVSAEGCNVSLLQSVVFTTLEGERETYKAKYMFDLRKTSLDFQENPVDDGNTFSSPRMSFHTSSDREGIAITISAGRTENTTRRNRMMYGVPDTAMGEATVRIWERMKYLCTLTAEQGKPLPKLSQR